MTDYSFIRLYLNDFASAKRSDNPAISKLNYQGFIVQKPSETFLQISNSSVNISFVGGITVDLVDCFENLVKNIDNNFYYSAFTDSKGIEQIAFEFGKINTDYWTKPVFLRITDDINGNKWYSNSFLVTDYLTDISSRFDYFNQSKIYDISYDIVPYLQSIRISNCYDQTPQNKKEVKQYITSQGKQVNYRPITTFLRKYLIDSLDYSLNDRLDVLFSHQQIYLNGERVVVSDYKADERIENTNFLKGEFVINKQGETFTPITQLFQVLQVIDRLPKHNISFSIATKTSIGNGGYITIFFNKKLTLINGITAKLYKDGILVDTVVPTISSNTILSCNFSAYFITLANGSYDVVIEKNKVFGGGQFWEGYKIGEYHFNVVDGYYNETYYNQNYYLTN